MLGWIKFESSILLDSRIHALLEDHGFCGLGIYVALRTAIESSSKYGLPRAQVLSIGAPYTRKSKIERIIKEYGLFQVSDELVTVVPLTPASGHRPGYTPAHTSGHEPFIENRLEENNIQDYMEGMIPADAPPKPSPSAQWDFATETWSVFY